MHGAVVLAAGASERMGRPKALLDFDGVPAVARVCTALSEGGCDRVVVVLGADADRIEPALPAGCEIIVHEHWRAGRSSSVKAGLEILQRADAVLLAPVDRPLFDPDDVRALLGTDALLAVPVHDGQRGHPLLIRRALFDDVLELDDMEPLHGVLHEHESKTAEVPTDNRGVLTNIDTPDDYEAALRLHRRWVPAT